MAVSIVLLGKLADLTGSGAMEIALPPGSQGPLNWDALLAALPTPLAQAALAQTTKVAVNGELLANKTDLAALDGDEIALLPPVSGG